MFLGGALAALVGAAVALTLGIRRPEPATRAGLGQSAISTTTGA